MLFETLASGSLGSLLNTVIVNTVNVLATFIAVAFVDKWGRRFLLMATAAWMCLLLVIVAIVLGVGFGKYGEAHSILPCPPNPSLCCLSTELMIQDTQSWLSKQVV